MGNYRRKYPVGSKHVAKVRNFTNFGVFVEIEEGVDGLIHISDLSWTKKVNILLNSLRSVQISKFKYWKSTKKPSLEPWSQTVRKKILGMYSKLYLL